MQYLFWEDHYDVGYDLFNEQHKEIFRLQNRVVNLIVGEAPAAELAHVLSSLVKYSENHFREEEALMARFAYPDLQSHREAHEKLVFAIFSLAEEIGKEKFSPDRLLDFLDTWITSHIMKVDQKYRKFFQGKLAAKG